MHIYWTDYYLFNNKIKINFPRKNRIENMNVQLAETQWDGNSVGKLDLTTSIDGLTELRDNEEKVH